MAKGKQVSNKVVPHTSNKAALVMNAENDALHATFAAGGKAGYVAPPKRVRAQSNAFLAKQWGCSERHASKVGTGRGEPECKPDCKCPIAQKKAAADAKSALQASA